MSDSMETSEREARELTPGEIALLAPGVAISRPEPMALFKAHPAFLARLLQLPEGAEIDGVDVDIHHRGTLVFRIRGAGWATPLGHAICEAQPIVHTRAVDAGFVLEWGFPA